MNIPTRHSVQCRAIQFTNYGPSAFSLTHNNVSCCDSTNVNIIPTLQFILQSLVLKPIKMTLLSFPCLNMETPSLLHCNLPQCINPCCLNYSYTSGSPTSMRAQELETNFSHFETSNRSQ